MRIDSMPDALNYILIVLLCIVIFSIGREVGLHSSMKKKSIGTLKIPITERTDAKKVPAIELNIDTPLDDLPKEDYVSILLSIIEEDD